jgi:hypothetical protein
MANVTVIGAQWGDEGKGKLVDWLSNRADVVVRFQGGHNAGHTLVVGEGFHFDRVAGGVAIEHRRLLARMSPETHVRFDDEFGSGCGEALGEGLPVSHLQDDAEVWHGHVVAVDRVARFGRRRVDVVRDDLVAVEVEIDPTLGAASFRTAYYSAPERSRLCQVAHREGEMERAQGHWPSLGMTPNHVIPVQAGIQGN